MKSLKNILLGAALFLISHVVFVTVFSLTRIFPCQIGTFGGNGQTVELRDGMCDINYWKPIGVTQRLTPGATAAKIGLIYMLPALITVGVIRLLYFRKK